MNLSLDECPIARSLDVIGDRWTLLIVRDAFQGKTRFGEFQRNLGLAKNILAARLRKLVEDGIFRQEPDDAGSGYQRYVLTGRGHRLAAVLVALWQWGEDERFDDGETSYRCVDATSRQSLSRLEVSYSDGKKVDVRKFAFTAVPNNGPAV